MTGWRVMGSMAAAGILLFLAPGCGDDESTSLPATFVGEVAGTEFFVAIAAQSDSALAYLCDGDETDQWFSGAVEDGQRIDITAEGGNHIEAELADRGFVGEVSIDGAVHEFTANRGEGNAGLYRVEDEDADELTGWIVLSDDRQKGVTRTGDTKHAAPTLALFSSRARPTISPF